MPTKHRTYSNVRVFNHPLIQVKLTRLRDRDTPMDLFRLLLNQIAGLMTFEVTRHLPVKKIEVQTPLEATRGVRLAAPVTLVPILRAGIGMTDGILALIPEARVGHIGVYRNEKTLEPVSYYAKFPPDIAQGPVLLIDPMLATGGSASYAVSKLKARGCHEIKLICLVSAPPGIERLQMDHPDTIVYTASVDHGIDARGFIHPGLGDAGDRIFGTA